MKLRYLDKQDVYRVAGGRKHIKGRYIATHGKTDTKVHCAWMSMRLRCGNKNNKCYEIYGGRGIKVCKRWARFENFLKDMGEPPSDKHSLDRIDSNKDYKPSNCRWATTTEQNRNRRGVKFNESDVRMVRYLRRRGFATKDLGKIFHTNAKYIRDICNKFCWKDVA